MVLKKIFIISLITFIFSVNCFAQNGSLRGNATDMVTLQPLIGANIILTGTSYGMSTDNDGNYRLENIPVGVYSLTVSYIGYETKVIPNIVIKAGKVITQNIGLNIGSVKGEEVVVTTSLFTKSESAPVSTQTLDQEEIRRSPGAREDVSRMIQNFAGVAPTSDDRNDLIVRGGSPTEVLFTIDHFDIPNPNHFGTQGATGGPISMINNEFIENVKFMAGGFSANYGQKLSGVLDIKFREGNREEYNGKLNLDFGGAGGYFEGPIQNGRGSFLFGYHRSFLELFQEILAPDGLPIYTNFQGKIVYDLNKSNMLNFLIIGGDDKIEMDDKVAKSDFSENNVDTLNYPNNVDFNTRQYTTGLSLKTFWNKNLYSINSLSQSYNRFLITSINKRYSAILNDGKLSNKEKLLEMKYYDNNSIENSYVFKSDWVWSLPNRDGLYFGFYTKMMNFDHDIWYKEYKENSLDQYGQAFPEFSINTEEKNALKYGSYINFKKKFIKNFVFNIGTRYDYNQLLKEGNFSPRFSAKWQATNRLSFNTGIGRYYQSPEFIVITSHKENKDLLKELGANHFIAGFEYLLTENTRLTVDTYHKKYFQYPVAGSNGYEMISTANFGGDFGIDGVYNLVSKGKGKVSGIDIMVQKKIVNNLYGLASYSYSKIEHKALDNVWRPGKFDSKNVFNLVLGYRMNKSHEISCKYRFAGGTPYTPFDKNASLEAGSGVLDLSRLNNLRYKDYQRFDIRYDHREYHKNFTIVEYFSIENLFNTQNLIGAFWDDKSGTTEFVEQTPRYFVGGISIEF